MGKWTVRIMVTALVGAALAPAPAAFAKDGIRVAGTCSKSSTSKLKLGREDAGTEVEFQVDQNRNGVRWRVALFRIGTRVASRVLATHAPSGSFEARFVAAGGGRFVARATSPSGEVCTAAASTA